MTLRPRARAAVLPGRPARAVREGAGAGGCRDPRPRGRGRRRRRRRAARGALIESDARPRRASSCASTRVGTDDFAADLATLVADRLPHGHGRQGRVGASRLVDDRSALRGRSRCARRRAGVRARRRDRRAAATSSALMWGAEDLVASPRRHVEPQAERPLPRRRAHARVAGAARRRRARQGRDRRRAPRHRRRRSGLRDRGDGCRGHPGSPRPRASTRARSRSSARAYRPDADEVGVGARRAGGRARASAACSRTRAAWSTSRCCATRARCWRALSRRRTERQLDRRSRSQAATRAMSSYGMGWCAGRRPSPSRRGKARSRLSSGSSRVGTG